MHILIEQKLQNIGVFAYADFHKEEVDLQIDTALIKLIETTFTSDGKNKTKFEDNVKLKDKLKELEVRNSTLSFDKLDQEYIALLPTDYNHRISDSSNILYQCSTKKIELLKIEKDKYYLVFSGTDLTYNGKAYKKGEYFKGVQDFNSYGYTVDVPVVYLMEETSIANVNTELEYYDKLKNNALTTSSIKGLLSTISGKNLIVFCPNFFLNKLFITYIKEPKNANYNFKTYINSDTLVLGKEYEVVSGTVTYNGNDIVYSGFNKLNSFKIVTGFLSFAGTGKVRLKDEGDLEINNTTSYYIIEEVAKALAIATEQNQQKIVNMTQNGIPN